MKQLVAYLYGREVGTFTERLDKRVEFYYSPDWLTAAENGDGHSLSISMPLTTTTIAPEPVEAFIAGLLPDSILHRRLLADQLDISDEPTDFAFLSKLGRDCAGAITIVPAGEDVLYREKPSYQKLSEAELAEYIRTLPQRPLLVDEDGGVLLSLAGVNDKAAVVVVDKQIALPHFGFPTSHIIKPDIASLPESIRVEHFCLRLAKECGQTVPPTKIVKAEDQVFMQMARYDRMLTGQPGNKELVRLHQEDFCQALGYGPEKKYERKGGPSWKQCFDLMKETENPVEATKNLLDRAIFQYLIGNPDAHAKNYSLLYRKDGSKRLAPFYDLNNANAFKADFKTMKPLMAMAIGGEFDRTKVTLDNWLQFADDCDITHALVLDRLGDMSRKIIEATPRLRDMVKDTVADSNRLDIVVDDVRDRAKAVLFEFKKTKVRIALKNTNAIQKDVEPELIIEPKPQ